MPAAATESSPEDFRPVATAGHRFKVSRAITRAALPSTKVAAAEPATSTAGSAARTCLGNASNNHGCFATAEVTQSSCLVMRASVDR